MYVTFSGVILMYFVLSRTIYSQRKKKRKLINDMRLGTIIDCLPDSI